MSRLRDFTSARVELGVVGDSLPVRSALEFQLAHARARDAVHFALDERSIVQDMWQGGWPSAVVRTQARDRSEYLRRPDLGRLLSPESEQQVAAFCAEDTIAFVVADGLSALAAHRHARPLLRCVFESLETAPTDGQPIWIAHQARVAIGDHIGELTQASLSVVMIGERPGLSTPDSLGVYLTWRPRRGRTDAERNCISNIHAQGLSYPEAAHKLTYLIREAQRRRMTGVALKEEATALHVASSAARLSLKSPQ